MAVQSLQRAFAVLRVVADEPAGLSEVARRVDLPKSTVARLLAALEAEGAVERRAGRYWIGPEVVELSVAVSGSRRLVDVARPELERLVEISQESAGIGVPEIGTVRYLAQLNADRAVQVRDWTGTAATMHTAASGLSMLAAMPPSELDTYLSGELDQPTEHSLGSADAVRRRLDRVRRDGYAWGHEEFVEGLNSVAAVVRDSSGSVVAAIDLWGPAYRFPGDADERVLGTLVAEAAHRVSDAVAAL